MQTRKRSDAGEDLRWVTCWMEKEGEKENLQHTFLLNKYWLKRNVQHFFIQIFSSAQRSLRCVSRACLIWIVFNVFLSLFSFNSPRKQSISAQLQIARWTSRCHLNHSKLPIFLNYKISQRVFASAISSAVAEVENGKWRRFFCQDCNFKSKQDRSAAGEGEKILRAT